MATFAVAFDGTRVVDASSTTGWTAEGATPTAEPDFFYQGGGSISAKIKTTEAGFYYTSSSQDMSGTPRVWILKILANNKDALDGNGLLVRIGSSTTDYYEYRKWSSSTYPIAGGWVIAAIDPNISQWRDATGGSGATLTAIVYWALRSDYNATAKSENTAMDAIDTVARGTGLTGTLGDGASADGTFADFLTADEGTSGNRWGVVHSKSGILFVTGVLSIGNSGGTVVNFDDSNRVMVFPDTYTTTGFCGLDLYANNASSTVVLTGCVLRGRGALTGSDDTRPDYTCSGTSGTITISGCRINTFRQIDLTSAVTMSDTVVLNGLRLVQSGATISSCDFSLATTGDGVGFLASDDPSKIQNCQFTFSDGHAIEITATGEYTFTGNKFTGYGSGGTNDAAIYNNSGGSVTLNVTGGGDTPTVRNGSGASTTVNNNTQVTLTGLVNPTEVRVYTAGTATELAGSENVTTGTFVFSQPASTSVDIRIFATDYEPADIVSYTVPASDTSIPIQQRFDRNYSNP